MGVLPQSLDRSWSKYSWKSFPNTKNKKLIGSCQPGFTKGKLHLRKPESLVQQRDCLSGWSGAGSALLILTSAGILSACCNFTDKVMRCGLNNQRVRWTENWLHCQVKGLWSVAQSPVCCSTTHIWINHRVREISSTIAPLVRTDANKVL